MSNHPSILELTRSQGILRSRDLNALPGARVELSALVKAGKLQRVSRGLYALPDREVTEHSCLAEIAIKYPNTVFCLLTALQLHELTTQSPHEVWIAIDRKARAPRIAYPPLRVARFSGDALDCGVIQMTIDGVVQIPVTSIAKTIADCFKYRNKIGLDVALEALQQAWRSKKVSMDELQDAAHVCRVANIIRPYVESLM